MSTVKEERKEKICDFVGIKHDMSHKDTGKSFLWVRERRGRQEGEERYPNPSKILIH